MKPSYYYYSPERFREAAFERFLVKLWLLKKTEQFIDRIVSTQGERRGIGALLVKKKKRYPLFLLPLRSLKKKKVICEVRK